MKNETALCAMTVTALPAKPRDNFNRTSKRCHATPIRLYSQHYFQFSDSSWKFNWQLIILNPPSFKFEIKSTINVSASSNVFTCRKVCTREVPPEQSRSYGKVPFIAACSVLQCVIGVICIRKEI